MANAVNDRNQAEAWLQGCADSAASHVSEHAVERPRDAIRVERVDEEARIADLPVAEPASQLLLAGLRLLRGLLLERAKRSELPLPLGDLLDCIGAERADQLVLEIRDADVEAQPFHVEATEVRAQAGTLEAATELALLRGIAEPGEPEV